MPRIRWWVSFVAALLLAPGCGSESPTRSLDRLQAEVAASLAAGNRGAAIDLLESQPPGRDPVEVWRIASLFAAAGEATRARWRIEEGLSRFPDDEKLRISLARIALLLADPREASASASSIPEESELHPEALMLRAQAALALGKLEEALALYDAFTDRYPERPDAVLARIATLERERRFEEALAATETAMSTIAEGNAALADSRDWLLLRQAALLARLDRRDEAISALRDLLAEQPESPGAWSMLFDLEAREGRGQAVADELVAAVEAHPEWRSLYAMAAAIHRRAGRAAAADELTEAILEDAKNGSPYLALANDRISAGDFAAALALLEQAIARFPRSPEPRMMRFDLLLALDRLDEARQEQVALGEMLPATEPALEYLQARLDLADGQHLVARARLERLVPEFDRAQTQYWLGVALEEVGDAEGAQTRYGQAMRRDGAWPLPKHALWRHARAAEDWASVIGLGRSLLATQPDDPDVWASVIKAMLELGKPEEALAAARQARERLPDEPSVAAAEAHALRALGRVDEALKALSAAESKAPEHKALWASERALVLAQSGRLGEALGGLLPALEGHPDDPRLLYVESSLYYGLGRGDEGDRATERLLALSPGRIDARYNRCRFRVASGHYAEALDDCRLAAAGMTTNSEAHFVLGVALERAGHLGEAETVYAEAIALDERDVRARVNLVELQMSAGRVDQALAGAQAAYRLAPDHPNVLDQLGRLYLIRDRPAQAARFFEEAAERAPERAEAFRSPIARARAMAESVARDRVESGDESDARSTRQATPHPTLEARLAAMKRPNFVLFLVDTLRADATTPYGNPQRPTPELARWAASGVVFERVRSQSSWTKMSMASLMTSLWPRTHGIVEADDGLGPEAVTLAEVMQSAGYATYAVQTNGWLHQSFGFHQGFDRYLFPQGGHGRQFEKPSVWPHADRVVAEGIELIERHDTEKPFFLYLHFMDVHEYAAPPEFKRYGTSAKGSYIASAHWVDDAVRRVRIALESAGVADDTVLIFASDHAETFGEHGVHGHARNVLSPVVAVPLVIRFPFALEAPVRIPSQVRNLDIAPTVIELAGLEAPASFEGASLVPLITGNARHVDRVSFARLGVPLFPDASAQSVLQEADWTYAKNAAADRDDPKSWRSRAVDPGREQLFEHAIDPGENVDLLHDAPEQAARLRRLLEAHLAGDEAGIRERGIRIDPGIAEKLRALGYMR